MDALHARPGPAYRAFGPFVLDAERAELKRDGRPVALRPKTFALLVHLAGHSGVVVPKQELLDAVWPGLVVTDDSLTQAISQLRAALGDLGPALIRTVPRRGYLFDAVVGVPPPATAGQAVSGSEPATPVPGGSSRWAVRGVAAAFGAALVALLLLGLAQMRPPSQSLDAALAESRSIVVLPFADLSEPPAPHLAYAVDDDLTTDLGRHTDLRVIARASAAALGAGAATDPRRAGREVDARYVLAGSVQRLGKAVSINVRLMRSDSGELLWSNRYDYASVADWAQRREISARVANLLQTKVTSAALADAVRDKSNGAAVDHWMRGRYILDRLQARATLPEAKGELLQARAHFEAALALEPESLQAISGLAFTHVCEVLYRWSDDRKATLATAAGLARRALAIDPNDMAALKALAGAQMFDGDLEGSMQSARRQLEINPSDAHSVRDLAATLYFFGRWEEALQQLALAERLNPLDPSHLDKVFGMTGTALIALGRYDDALVSARRLASVSPRSGGPYIYSAAAHAHRGDLDTARHAAAELLRRRPGFMIGADSQRGSTVPAYLAGMQHLYDGLRLAGAPERPASAPR